MQPTPCPAAAPITENTPDTELAERAAGGEEAAFETIMRRHNQLLFRTARSILRSDAEAEDTLQEAWIRAWRALVKFRADARLSTWLVRIVANEALGRLRRKRAAIVPLDAVMNATNAETQSALADNPDRLPDRAAMRAQLRRLLEARIDMLPETFRTVFVLRAVEEWNVAEVAEALEIPEATVRSRFFRARRLMRENLADDIDLEMPDAFSFDGLHCDRIVAAILRRARADGLAAE
ncbi:MAG: RNA polymerase sigma factor [Gammaproteobacteria bacterium]